jgi:hypothetical protein
MVMIDLNIREHLGSNVGIWSGDRYRPDCNRFGMFGGLMTQGCNVGWGAPVGNTWSYAGRNNPYYAWANEAQRMEREERGRAMLETGVMPGPYWSSSGRPMSATSIYTGQTYGTPGYGYYGNDRAFGNGAQISGVFNSRANFVDFNFSNNSFGRPQFGGQRAAFDVGLNLGNVNLNVGGVINNLFHHR